MTLKVRILPFLTTFAQLSAGLINFLGAWLLVLGIKEGFVEFATVCVKSVVILTQRQRNWINFEFGTQRSPKMENSRSLFCIVIYCCPLFLYEAIIVKKYEATFCIHWAFAFISNLTLFFTQLVLQIQVTIKKKKKYSSLQCFCCIFNILHFTKGSPCF